MTDQGADDAILVLNAGSSSIKLAVFGADLRLHLSGMAEGIGGAGQLRLGEVRQDAEFPDHAAALKALLAVLESQGWPLTRLGAVAHRVVHGGRDMTRPMRLTPDVRGAIEACAPLAPLHNPNNLAAIDAISALAPDLPQSVSFDTAFHATNPEVALRYGLSAELSEKGYRRYGFHGQSYAALVRTMPEITGRELPRRILAYHLGNGASACAIADGHSVASTMGYSPLDGLTMGTRSGAIDGNAVLRMAEEFGIDRSKQMLNHEAGLIGLSGGLSDMRALLADDSADSQFAVEHFCYWATRHGGSLIAAMGGVDAVIFTGGIGENAAPIRARIAEGFAWLGLGLDENANDQSKPQLHKPTSKIACWIIPADEERQIAADAIGVLKDG